MKTVAELAHAVEMRDDERMDTTLGNLVIDGDAEVVRIRDTRQEFPLDEVAERALADYLSVPKPYLKRCPSSAKAYNLNLWINESAGKEVRLEYVDGQLLHVLDPNMLMIPLSDVADIITNVFRPTDRVVWLQRDSRSLHVDIQTDHTTIVPWDARIPDRAPQEVGDITNGGVRFLVHPGQPDVAPSVQAYLTRLKCTNGLCSSQNHGTITIKGQTVEQVCAEMEAAAQRLLAGMDERLEAYHAMAHQLPPGNSLAFAYQIGKERKVPARVMEQIVKIVGGLPDEATTLYDVAQAFSQVANDVVYKDRMNLQSAAGEMAFRSGVVLHRCATCQQTLDT